MGSADIHDIPFDKLKALIQKLIAECEKLPSNKSETWQECEQEARRELLKRARAEARKRRAEEKKQTKIAEEEAKKEEVETRARAAAAARASGLSSSSNGSPTYQKPKTALDLFLEKAKKKKPPEPLPSELLLSETLNRYTGANRRYLQENVECYNRINELLRKIDYALLPTYKQRLLTYDRAKNTLLAKDWSKIRLHFERTMICDFSPMGLSQTIDALNIIEADMNLIQPKTAPVIELPAPEQPKPDESEPETPAFEAPETTGAKGGGKKKWTPPKGYTGSNTVINSTIADLKSELGLPSKRNDDTYKMPRSTLAYREKQDKKVGGLLDGVTTKRDPVSNEVWYPNNWLKKVLQNYKPRSPKL